MGEADIILTLPPRLKVARGSIRLKIDYLYEMLIC